MASFEPSEVSDGERVAWVTQGVVLYIEGSLERVWSPLLQAFDRLLARPWAHALRRFRRWDEPAWRPWDAQTASWVRPDAQRAGASRRYWKLELADEPRFASTSVDWQDIPAAHDARYPRTSYLRVRLPLDTPARELLDVTCALCAALPVQQGCAGYLCHVAEESRGAGFDQAWAWARRYYRLHVVDPVKTTWDAVHGVCGVNWLTVVGERWLRGPLQASNFDASAAVQTHRATHGVIVQAGERPSLGDQHRFDDLSAYTHAARAVEAALIEAPSSLPGMFSDHDSTPLWLRRFLDPAGWRDSA